MIAPFRNLWGRYQPRKLAPHTLSRSPQSVGTKGQGARVPRESDLCPLLPLWGIEDTRVPYSQRPELRPPVLEAIRQVSFQRECLFMT